MRGVEAAESDDADGMSREVEEEDRDCDEGAAAAAACRRVMGGMAGGSGACRTKGRFLGWAVGRSVGRLK